ncbi:hypothetical protein VPH35_016939 [Triticum aestivum]|uniref:Uncharacterized protein n=1 Tax=Aegilops tauschii TaxID=37682 RepID=N1QVY4_AEGTA
MSVQVAAKKAAEAAAFGNDAKKPSACIADYLDDLAILSKHIQMLRAKLETVNDAGFFEHLPVRRGTYHAWRKFGDAFEALRVTDGLLKRRAYFRKQQQLDKKPPSPD